MNAKATRAAALYDELLQLDEDVLRELVDYALSTAEDMVEPGEVVPDRGGARDHVIALLDDLADAVRRA
jgi:hypothetical protein